MKHKLKLSFFIIFATLLLTTVYVTYSRYVITQTIEVEASAPSNDAGSLDFSISNQNNIYNVATSSETTKIASTVTLENKYNINVKSYYAWTTANKAPESNQYTEFEFPDSNQYTVENDSAKIGNYYLWVKITYSSEIGEEQTEIKTSKMISVVLGDIKISLDDQSEYLTGDVTATIKYVGEYTLNSKAGYGKSEEEAIANATAENANSITIKKEEIDTIYYIYAYAENASGDSITSIFPVDNIDNINPVINAITPSFARAKISVSDNKSGIKSYTITTTNVEPTTYDKTLDKSTLKLDTYVDNLKTNTTYYLWIKDAVGNVCSQQFQTKELEYTATPNLSDWTKENIRIEFCELGEAVLTYNLGGTNNYTYNASNGIEVSENTTVNYVLQDGNSKVIGTIKISNIDKIAPTVNITSNYKKVTINGTDKESGILGYIVTDTEITDFSQVKFKEVDSNTTSLNIDVTTDYLGNKLVYNTQYYVYLKDRVGNISRGDIISTIDDIEPTINIIEKTSTTNSVSISVEAVDNESGFEGTYNYYISTESGVYNDEAIETINSRYIFSDLKDNELYYIKIKIRDKAGNETEKEVSISTSELTIPNESTDITFSNAIWKSNIQTVTVKTTLGYKMRYQIVKENGTLSLENSDWSVPIDSGENVTNLEHGDILYIRIYDGTNSSLNYASYNVINEMKQEYPTITEKEMNAINYGTNNVLTYEANENSATVSTQNATSGTKTYNYYIKNIKSNEYELKMTSSLNDEKVIVNEKTKEQTYQIVVVELSNNASGTLSKCTNTSIVISRAQANKDEYYSNNRTYIDDEYYTAVVPAGFKVSSVEGENTISSGLVLKDANNNEVIWVPVENAIYDGKTSIPTSASSLSKYKPMARYQSGSSQFFEKIYYVFNQTSSYYSNGSQYKLGGNSYIEPSLITGSDRDKYTWSIGSTVYGSTYDADSKNYKDILGFDSVAGFGSYLNEEYSKIVESADYYKGFYVGRYETTVESEQIGTAKGKNILNNVNWYNLYKYQNSALYDKNAWYSSRAISSTMITGMQYDAMLNWMLKGKDKTKVTALNIGNKSNALSVSGNYSNDKINNIYDLASNAYEVTQESNSYNYRVYRGGGFDSTEAAKSSATRTIILPTEVGVIVGSRMALYLLDEGDNIPPTFTFVLTPSTNSIQVDVTATDEGTGINEFYYSISLSQDGNNWSDEVKTKENSYNFTGLNASTEYYIRVRVSDRVGNISDYIIKSCKTKNIEITTGAISLYKVYGKNGEGIALLKIKDTYKDLGYHIEYQVVKSGETFNENGTWTQGDAVTNLSNGEQIIARISLNGNATNTYLTFNITDLEEFSEVYTETLPYTDLNEDIAYIPKGFKRGITSNINTIKNGLVIEDKSGNQFVWIPVEKSKVVYDESTSIAKSEQEAQKETEVYRPMARRQTGTNSKFYEGMFYNFLSGGLSYWNSNATNTSNRIGTSGYSEPRVVIGQVFYSWDAENTNLSTASYDNYYYNREGGFSSLDEMGKYMNEEYYNMINSVIKFGGFYVGRYETTLESTSGSYSKNGNIVKVQKNKTPLTNVIWNRMYYRQDSNRYSTNPYYNSTSVVSSMIWGSQWDAMLNWMLTGNDNENITNANIGNHSGKTAKTGEYPWDINNNLIDLIGNVSEWTLQANNTWTRSFKGARFNLSGGAEKIENNSPMSAFNYVGTRMSLYIKNMEDTTAPTISKRSGYEIPSKTTNSIYVRVTAEDEEDGSGIDKYVYSISSDGGNTYVENICYGNTYKFTELEQNHTYYIKIKVMDKAGNVSTELTYDPIVTDLLEVKESDMYADAIYGVDGSGILYIGINSTLENQGYTSFYQVVHDNGVCEESGTWTKGRQVNNLKEKDVVYIKLTDEVNSNETIGTVNIPELEKYSEEYAVTKLNNYEDVDGNKATIPAGFKVGTSSTINTVNNGLVIKNASTGDEFVWVPVKNAVHDPASKLTIPTNENEANKNKDANGNVVSYKPMAKYQNGYNSTSSLQYFEGITYTSWSSGNVKGSYAQRSENSYAVGNSSYREPSLITNSNIQYTWIYKGGTGYDASKNYYNTILKFNNASDFGEYMNTEFTNMVQSVKNYGGFYVGRYETTLETSVGVYDKDSGTIVKSQIDKTSLANVNWYKMYYAQDSNRNTNNPYYGSTNVVSSMIWGCQWDAMLNWIYEGQDRSHIYEVAGNHSGTVSKTGQYGNDFMNNILDISSNVREWTLETYGSAYHAYRGGYFSTYTYSTASYRNYNYPTSTNNILGTRFTLYVK